jgi:asparagine synthase (glutamine-hydrolysing)
LARDGAARLSLLDQETYLISILHRQDKMSMAAGIESRVPFLDYRIVEFANRLPTSFKIKFGSGKRIVKDVARHFLPAEIVDRRKSGFGVPLDRWFREDRGIGERLIALRDGPIPDFLDRTELVRRIDDHRSGAEDHSEALWAVLNLCLWREAFLC